MTVCIAAACKTGDNIKSDVIVAVCDTKITAGGFYSGDLVSLKSERLHKNWHTLLAGKIGQRSPVINKIQDHLRPQKDSCPVKEISDCCKRAYIEYQRELAYEKVLSPFNLDLESFLKSRKEIGESQYERLWNAISSVQIGFDMLVFGFDNLGISRIFIVSNPTEENPSFITHHEDTKFASIGTGAYLAESALYAYGQYIGNSLEETAYHMLSAKFLAESASDVGKVTYLKILYPNGEVKRMNADFITQAFRENWKKHGQPRIDPGGLEILKNQIDKELVPV